MLEQCGQASILDPTPAQLCGLLDRDSAAYSALAQVIQVLVVQLTKLAEQMKTRVKAYAPALLEIFGVGPVLASVILSEVGIIGRFVNQGQFASYCGAAPVKRGSGSRT